MNLGAFSISLAVKDLAASRDFYEKLGFELTGGAMEQNYLILKNDKAVIGLFQGMFDRNILTFNPGLDVMNINLSAPAPGFVDVRLIRDRLRAAGLEVDDQTGESPSGPGHITLQDPDGNPILIDQFF